MLIQCNEAVITNHSLSHALRGVTLDEQIVVRGGERWRRDVSARFACIAQIFVAISFYALTTGRRRFEGIK